MGSEPSDGRPRPRVLIADDDAELLELYTQRLQSIGDYAVVTAGGGEEAWERLQSSVDLALLDETMPGRSGVELTRTVDDAGLDVPLVIVSGEEPTGDEPWNEFLQTPVHQDELRAILEQYL